MRILYVGHTYSLRINQAKLYELAALPGVEVLLVTPDRWKGELYDHFTEVGANSPSFRHIALKSYLVGKESQYVYSGRLFSLVEEFKPDIVHVEQGTYALSYAQVLLAAKKHVPHAKSLFFTWWNLPTQLSPIANRIEKFNLSLSSGAIAGNQDALGILVCKGFSRPIAVIPQLGVDPEEFIPGQNNELRAKLGLSKFVVGYVGRVVREKGVVDLVNAIGGMQSRSATQLHIVGNGPALSEVQGLSNSLGVQMIHTPSVMNDQVPAYLQTLDALVLPSRTTEAWVEQFGHVLIEAMSSGVPVIGSNSGEIPRVIETAGRIFSEGDVSGLAGILDQLVTSTKLQMDLARRGRERVLEHYTHRSIAEQQMTFYEELLAKGASIQDLALDSKRQQFNPQLNTRTLTT